MSTVSRDDLADTLAWLVQTPSINPDLVPDSKGERQLAEQIADRLREIKGVQVELREAAPGRPNVIATAGSGDGRTLMINGHTDTVDVEGMAEPFSGKVDDGKLYGRGAFDMKGSLAAMIQLVEAVARDDDFPGKVVATFVVDEEYASVGTATVCKELERWQPDAAIVTEPTDHEIVVAHKGFAWLTITTHGNAEHGSDYERGVDAIAHMGRVLHRIDELSRELVQRPAHQYIGPPSLHASLIEGGSGLSTYPATCQLKLERRTIPGETIEQVEQELRSILEQLRAEDETFQAELTVDLVRDPYEVDQDEAIVKTVAGVYERVSGNSAEFTGAAGWMDSALLGAAGVPTVVHGPTGDGPHAHVEWADLASLEQYTQTLTEIAYEFCGGSR